MKTPMITRCHNLRPGLPATIHTSNINPVPSALRPVAPPQAFDVGNWSIAGTIAGGLVLFRDNIVAWKHLSSSQPATVVATVPETPESVVVRGDSILAMTSSGAFRIDRDVAAASWTVMGYPPQWPALAFSIEERQFSVTVEGRTLSDGSIATRRFTKSDISALSADLEDGYRRLVAAAAAQGFFVQPEMVCYRLFDGVGAEIFRSAPQLLSPSQGAFPASVTLESDAEGRGAASYTLSATAYRPSLRPSAAVTGPWADTVAKAEVLVSPQMHAYDPSAPANCHVILRPTGNQAFMRLSLPGATTAPYSTLSAGAEDLLHHFALMASTPQEPDALFAKVLTIHRPFRTPLMTFRLAPSTSVTADIAALRKAVATGARVADRLTARFSFPNTFTAAVVANGANTTAYADLRAIRFPGFSPLAFLGRRTAPGSSDGAWRAVATVDFADGERRSVAVAMADNAPDFVMPVIAYPADDAVSITIQLQVAGESLRSAVFPLTPVSPGLAMYVAPSMLPAALPEAEGAFAIPAEREGAPLTLPNAMAVADAATPDAIAAVAKVGTGRIVAVCPACSPAAAWDFGRNKFTVLGAGGIHAVTIGSDGRRMAAVLLDSRPVTGAGAVACADAGHIMSIAGGDIVDVSHSGVKTLVANTPFLLLGWYAPLRELWCFTPAASEATVLINPRPRAASTFVMELGRNAFTASVGHVGATAAMPAVGLFIKAEGYVRRIPAGLPEGAVAVEFTEDMPMETAAAKGFIATAPRRRIALPRKGAFFASSFAGTLAVAHSTVPASEAALVTVAINGAVKAPMAIPFLYHVPTGLTVAIAATVAPDFTLLP